jgi:putative transposase
MKTKEELSDAILDQIKTGDDLNNFISNLHKRGIEKILEGEMDDHLSYPKHQKSNTSNSRNGYQEKRLKTSDGEIYIKVPRDRDSTFTPKIVPKRCNTVSGIENIIISLYAKGMSTRDIANQIDELYDIEVSRSTISRITDQIVEDVNDWQNRELDPVYCMLWLDGIVFKVRDQARVVNKTIYIALGLKQDGTREVLGLWVGRNESSSFWMGVLTNIKARGVKDILIAVTDNLKGFANTIEAVFPQAVKQTCIVHQIRNTSKYILTKDRKEYNRSLRDIYKAPNREVAEAALNELRNKWEEKYPYAVNSWENNWDELIAFIDYPLEMRQIMYTTNIIENLNGKLRKYTKNRLSFPNDNAVTKSVYLALREISKKWNFKIQYWVIIRKQLKIIFGDRVNLS